MTAFNIVRFRTKPGRAEDFLEAHRKAALDLPGLIRISLVQTGDNAFCIIGEWEDFDHLAAARPQMILILDSFRDTLEDLGGGLGLTDPVSGELVYSWP